MTPFYFGQSQQPLFGIYRPAREGSPATRGVLLCPPMGQDFMRSHRALRQLSQQLAKAGLHALRFDYRGLGDSWGDNTDASLAGWCEDVATAVDELKDTAAVKTVSLVGLRIGASVASLAAAGRSDIDSLVLWDPVVRGSDYLKELARLADAPVGDDEIMGSTGFALTPGLRRELAALDLTQPLKAPTHRRNMLVVSEPRADYERLRQHLASGSVPLTHAEIAVGASWDVSEQMGAMLLPQAIIRAITDHLAAA